MTSLNEQGERELATDLAAAQALVALFPEEVPHPLDIWDRIAERRARLQHQPRECAFLHGYFDLAEAHRDAQHDAAFTEFSARLSKGDS